MRVIAYAKVIILREGTEPAKENPSMKSKKFY